MHAYFLSLSDFHFLFLSLAARKKENEVDDRLGKYVIFIIQL